MSKIQLLAFSGSLRRDSYNTKLAAVAAAVARDAGAEVTLVNLAEFPMPLFDGDLESSSGMPDAARRFKALMVSHHGFLIASPEYNSSVSGVLKNAIDWASRTESSDEKPLLAFRGKVAGLLSASPGALGGLRGLVHLRAILGNLMVHVVPEQFALGRAHEAFDDSGALKDPGNAKAARGVVNAAVRTARALDAAD
ncbi:MAG: FMN reductase [Planctomycetaceae bacterium]|nr:FMN reductase [Planctomycetaceae bacterium]